MVRSEVAPGPYEGETIVDRSGAPLGSVLRLNVVGRHVVSFTIRTPDGREVDVPRDRFLATTAEGIQVALDREDFLAESVDSPSS